MPHYKLYYYPGFASLPVHLALNAIGASFDLIRIGVPGGESHGDVFRAINPHGQVPVLEFDGFRMNQTIGILEFLAGRHSEAKLAPAVADEQANAAYHMWLAYLSTTIQERFQPFFHPDRYVGDTAAYEDVKSVSERYLNDMFDWVETQLEPGPFLLGDRLSMPDFLLVTLIRWGRFLTPPIADRGRFKKYDETIRAVPSVKAVFEREGV